MDLLGEDTEGTFGYIKAYQINISLIKVSVCQVLKSKPPVVT